MKTLLLAEFGELAVPRFSIWKGPGSMPRQGLVNLGYQGGVGIESVCLLEKRREITVLIQAPEQMLDRVLPELPGGVVAAEDYSVGLARI